MAPQILKASILKRLPAFTLDVSLELLPNQVAALLGPSGAGKTTLLRCLAGLERFDAGEIHFGHEVWQAPGHKPWSPQARRIGMVFRPPALFPHLNARDNVAFGARSAARVEELLERMELGGFAARYPRQLSAGEQQRVAIARAIAQDPRILLLDEPFTGLDTALEGRLHEAFRAVVAELGIPVLLVTHDLAEASWLAENLGMMAEGKLLQFGPTAAVIASPRCAASARLAGVTNLFKAVGGAGVVRWGGVEVAAPHAPQGPLTMGIRPERVEISPDEGHGRLTGTITRVAPLAGRLRVAISIADAGTLQAHVDIAEAGKFTLVPGATMGVYLPPEHLLLLPAE